MGNRLVFLVEGDSELSFVENMVIPYLYGRVPNCDWSMNAQKITTNRKRNKKGGNISYQYFENEIKRLMVSDVWITTMLDFFRLPNDFPGFTADGKHVDNIEKSLYDAIEYRRFIPYIQKYEFETVLFSSIAGFKFLLDDDKQLSQIQKIFDKYSNPEDINGGSQTAPSKRLEAIFPYRKTTDSELILSEMTMEIIIDKCPRFATWIKKITAILI